MLRHTCRRETPAAVLGDVSNARAVLEACRKRVTSHYASDLPSKAASMRLLQDAVDMFKQMPSASEIKHTSSNSSSSSSDSGKKKPKRKMSICGDVHGQAHDFYGILDRIGGLHQGNMAFFNGDFVDRGPDGAEIFLSLCALKLIDGDSIHVNRGNHETLNMTRSYGFIGELVKKFGEDEDVIRAFLTVFATLPLAARVDERLLIVHGGIPQRRDTTIEDINKVNRFGINEPEGDAGLLLWSDPVEGAARGAAFNKNDTKTFLAANKCSMLIRSHECVPLGYQTYHNDRCVTIFSAPSYCGMKNKAAYIEYDFCDDESSSSSSSSKAQTMKFHQFSHEKPGRMAGPLKWHEPIVQDIPPRAEA